MNIIGLGKAGCKIAELFKEHPQYKVFLLDSEDKYKRRKNCFNIPQHSSAELYDANPIDLAKLIGSLDDDEEVYFIVCGSGKISACSLWILRELREKKVNIVYIKPDSSTLDRKSILRNKAHFHILQEYSRSGVFHRILIFDNNCMSDIIGKTSILNFYPKINQLVATSIHWFNIYTNSEPIFDTFREKYISSRIGTLSIVNVDKSQIINCYDMVDDNQIEYFFGVNRIRIENDEELFDKLTSISSQDSEEKSISFGVYPTELDEGFSFALRTSSEIQKEV
jgi:hypothetical protein